MKPKPVPNAKRIALRSYSMWANYAGIASLIAPEVIYAVWTVDTNPRIWWVLGLGLILAGIVGRLVDQGMTRSPGAVMAAALFLAMGSWPGTAPEPRPDASADPAPPYSQAEFTRIAVPLIGKWEGLRTKAYRDIVGVWTVCYGETKGVQPGDSYSEAECRAMLAREVLSYREGWHDYLTPETLTQRLHAARDAAYTSLAYNVGVAGAGKSTATRRLNRGDIAGGCEALTWWNKAGQRVVRGLVRRRADEYRLCMQGVA